ncbi:hypothetical protein [uncultured Prochlorococcus sp.]|uniref:hypothetical protein n=1 Tax=uncultured Prochlorococcus sp. TaxID=159733 RepID=UPI00258C566D|nr:hypothetical protein [uncultured Prochlorococcus sp.]
MEVLLFALFFISALIFFIAGKDDFGRTESKLVIKEEENIKEKNKVAEEIKKEDKVAEEIEKEDKVAEEIEKEDKVAEEIKKEDKVAGEGNIEPQKEIKKES